MKAIHVVLECISILCMCVLCTNHLSHLPQILKAKQRATWQDQEYTTPTTTSKYHRDYHGTRILKAELNAILTVIEIIQTTQLDTHIFTNSLNIIFLINNHIQHPTSQHHHPNKLLTTTIIHQIYWTPHTIHRHKVRAHSSIIGNKIVDTLANEGTLKEKPTTTPHKHIAHPSPYQLASCPTATHEGAIRNLHTTITKDHEIHEIALAKNKFPYVDKWLSNDQIKQKLSNRFQKSENVIDAHISQTLKFRYTQYVGNHKEHIFWPLKHKNPNCTLCHKNDRDTWPHLLSTCENPYRKGLRIARHNKVVHLITRTLQANKNTWFFTLTNACKLNNKTPEQTIPLAP